MKLKSENLNSEKSLIKKTLTIVLFVVFAEITVPAYVLYQTFNVANTAEFRKLLRKSLLLTWLYSVPFYALLFLMGLSQDGGGENYTTVVALIVYILYGYSILHIMLLLFATIKRNVQILRKLTWMPAVVLLAVFTLIIIGTNLF